MPITRVIGIRSSLINPRVPHAGATTSHDLTRPATIGETIFLIGPRAGPDARRRLSGKALRRFRPRQWGGRGGLNFARAEHTLRLLTVCAAHAQKKARPKPGVKC